MSPWIPTVVTVALGLIGLSIQGMLFAYFVGRMKEAQVGQANLVKTFQEFTEKTIDALLTRMSDLDAMAAESRGDRSALNARLTAVERNTDGLQSLRESFAGHKASFDAHRERTESGLAQVQRQLDGIHRQLANIATGKLGEVIELAGKEKP